jgi:hypothetical protein
MQHPFIDTKELSEKSLDDIQTIISGLTSKLSFAYKMQNPAMISQLHMALESYKVVYAEKIQEIYKKQNIPDQINIKKGNV